MMKINIKENPKIKKDSKPGQVRKDEIGIIVLVIPYDEFLTTYNAIYLTDTDDNSRFDPVYDKGVNCDEIAFDFPFLLEAELNISDI